MKVRTRLLTSFLTDVMIVSVIPKDALVALRRRP